LYQQLRQYLYSRLANLMETCGNIDVKSVLFRGMKKILKKKYKILVLANLKETGCNVDVVYAVSCYRSRLMGSYKKRRRHSRRERSARVCHDRDPPPQHVHSERVRVVQPGVGCRV
jgi:hypothetical protein